MAAISEVGDMSTTNACSFSKRRELFPTSDDESSDDLSSVLPLNTDGYDCTPSIIVINNVNRCSLKKFSNSQLSDYEFLENITVSSSGYDTSSLAIPLNHTTSSTEKMDVSIISNETPSSRSMPNLLMKTPEDSVTATSFSAPKLLKKSPFVNQNLEAVSLSTSKLTQKPDHLGKVRTTLFPQSCQTVPVPLRSFYSDKITSGVGLGANQKGADRKIMHKLPKVYLCNRKARGKKRFGEINAGVRHKIRKPKRKKHIAVFHDMMENCTRPILEYLNDLKHLSCTVRQIQEFKNIDEPKSILTLAEPKGTNFGELQQSKKRKVISPLPDANRKFFKHKRGNATVTLDERVKFVLDEGKLTLLDGKNVNNLENQTNLIVSDLDLFDEEDLISHNEVESIIFSLSTQDDTENSSVLKPYSSLPKQTQMDCSNASESETKSIPNRSVFTDAANIMLSPTTQICSITSGLALNSPKKAVRKLNDELDKENIGDEKLYPIFYGPRNPPRKPAKMGKPISLKKLKPLPKDQMLLDAGQKNFGTKQCTECNFVYHMGDVNDELMHQNYHSAVNVLRFCGWKDEQVMSQTEDWKIIRVVPHDPKPWLKKIKDLLDVVNKDLGYYDMEMFLENSQVYLYIMNKTIVGCLVAEPKTIGYRMLSDDTGIDLCSEIAFPIKCGVSRVWVAQTHRLGGIGRTLMNCLRSNFLYGGVLCESDIAFSSPTIAGKAFATKYFNTPNFLVYYC